VVALPDQLFYNTVTATYVWILTNRKEPRRVGKVQLIDGRRFFVRMARGQGYKRCKLGDPADRASEPDQIGDLTRIYGNFCHGETRRFVEDDPIGGDRPVERVRIVSKVLDSADFGFRKIVVERPLRLRFQVTGERLSRLSDMALGDGMVGMVDVLRRFRASHGERVYDDRAVFLADLRESGRAAGMRLTTATLKIIERAFGERDEHAAICRDREGRAEPDPELRDTESVPLTEQVDDYLAREVLPHHPDAWIDHAKTRIGYEIPFNRHFYAYEPPRPLQAIEADIRALEQDIRKLLDDVVP
jgi:type I restriction enzyme M protein